MDLLPMEFMPIELTQEQLALREKILEECFFIQDISELFSEANWAGEQIVFASECIREWLRKYKCPESDNVNEKEVLLSNEIIALTHLYITFKGLLVDQEMVSRVLRNNTFCASLNNTCIIQLIDIILKTSNNNEELKKGVVQWITRLHSIKFNGTQRVHKEALVQPKGTLVQSASTEQPHMEPAEQDPVESPEQLSVKSTEQVSMESVKQLPMELMEQLPFPMELMKDSKNRIKKIFINTLQWWSDNIDICEKTNAKFINVYHWIIKIHLESKFVGGTTKKILESLQTICSKKTVIHPTIFAIFRVVIPSLVQNIKIDKITEFIFTTQGVNESNKLNLLTDAKEYKKLSINHRLCISDIFLNSLIKLEKRSEHVDEIDDNNYIPSYFNRGMNTNTLNLMILLKQDSLTWSCVIPWYYLEQSLDNHQMVKGNEDTKWNFIEKFVNLVSNQVLNTNDLIEKQMITVEEINQITSSPSILGSTFNYFGLENSYVTAKNNKYFIDSSEKEFKVLKNVIQHMFNKEDQIVQLVKLVESSWRTLTINDLCIFFRMVPPNNNSRLSSGLPSNIINSYLWFEQLKDSKMFMHIWNSSNSTQYLRIVEVSRLWKQLYQTLTDDEILFGTFEKYREYLSTPSELVLLLKTANGFYESDQVLTWSIQVLNEELFDSVYEKICDLMHFSNVYKSRTSIQRVLSSVQIFLSDTVINEINNKKEQLEIIHELIKDLDWNSIQLSDLPKYTKYSSQFHPQLLKLSPELFELASTSLELFQWLREMPDDADFTSSVEMAMSKSEMECPSELWQEEAGKPGRPDEEKLSMISSVRSYLHGIIYRVDDKINTYEEIIMILINLRDSDPIQLISSLRTCNEYSSPLKEILNSDSENTPEKLMSLYLPNKCATFVCSNTEEELTMLKTLNKVTQQSGLNEQLWLQWNSISIKNEVSIKILNFNELMDFQTSIVLSKTDHRSPATQSFIEKFISQLGWMKELYDNIIVLYNSGNFDYQNFTIKFAIDTEVDVIRAKALEIKQISEEWNSNVERMKDEHYYLNFFSTKQLWNFVKCLKYDRISENSKDIFTSLIQMVDSRHSFNADIVNNFIKTVTLEWDDKYQNNLSGCQVLDLLGNILRIAMEPLPITRRLINKVNMYIDDSVHVSKTQLLNPGIHLIVSENSGDVVDQILSTYYKYNYLPESEDIYMCKKTTTWEELYNVVNRWKNSHLHSRTNRLYCIGYTQVLNFELQYKLICRLKESEPYCKNPLLLVSHGIENQYLVSQYLHKRFDFKPISMQELKSIGDIITQKYSHGIHVYSSMSAGAGKTFQIRSKSYNSKYHYIHFPIYNTLNIVEKIINKTKEVTKNNNKILLHIDLADSVPEDINAFLFDLVYLGSVLDSINGNHYCWNPQLTCICIEVASDNLLRRIRTCELLNQEIIQVSGTTLCVTYKDLIGGMGEEFNTPRCDGTRFSVRKEADKNFIANAYQRLNYVCSALDLIKKNGGKFPHMFNGFDIHDNDSNTSLLSERYYKLLMEFAKLDPTKPSLWCLWNFINVLYFQLYDMHYQESPINYACMPDSESTADIYMKSRIKGEVIHFLIKTAREFATRQIKKEDPNIIVGLYVTGASRADWNCLWNRTEFDNDDEPCFCCNNQFYIYYRSVEKRWVLDDVLEPQGSSFARSLNEDINSEWKTCSNWERDLSIKIKKTNNPQGYQSQGLSITGPPNKQGSIGESEYGDYVRLPQYDDIEGRPHYVKIVGESRRHIFWSSIENTWQICPVCNNDEGAYGLSVSSNIEDIWRFMPPDKVEKNINLRFVTLHEKRNNSYRNRNPTDFVAVEKEDDEDFEKLMNNLLMWNESNHECLLFSNEQHTVRFLSMDPVKMRLKMHPRLLEHLKENKINVGEDLNTLNANFYEILGSLTGNHLSLEKASNIMGGNYCLTGDSLLKMLAIFIRTRCGLPVVLMGECGCGKTMLIKFLCAWLNVKLFVLDVHGGTTEEHIYNIFAKAEQAVINKEVKEAYVFLDEINTCAHMGLMCEVICQRSLYGNKISEDIKILAALNPYRKRPDIGHVPGLIYKLHDSNTIDPMAQLVYRVHPIPKTLRDFIFDFGSLSHETERLYIYSMISKKFPDENKGTHDLMTEMLLVSQDYVRSVEKESSATSLRDVERCMTLTDWFFNKIIKKTVNEEAVSQVEDAEEVSQVRDAEPSALASSFVLGIAFVYYFRLNTAMIRQGLWKVICDVDNKSADHGFESLNEVEGLEKVIIKLQNEFCKNILLEDDIAMNQALMENLFVTIICILNRIPIFVVGKPGSSKTLTLQVIANNLQGKQSPNIFWHDFPAVYIFQYQCSPMSESNSIQHQFDMAVRYQQHAENVITVLLLDEVGLAEHSPDMPLKVLHGMLVDPSIAIVGLSNWTLDPAKMNRAICLQRTDPSSNDIQYTGNKIVSSKDNAMVPWLESLATSYHHIYTSQKGREFIGMRDYYSLIKYLRLNLHENNLNKETLTHAICRNFGGKPEVTRKTLEIFHKNCFNSSAPEVLPPCKDLLIKNLNDKFARHLMVLTRNGAALQLMFGAGILDKCNTVVLIGNEFKDDRTELHIVQQINEVKLAMANGKTLVLVNHDNIYEALYDVLNQRYLFKKDKAGITRKMLRLAIGSRSQLCSVADSFKMIVIIEEYHAYNNLDLPLLNRFEKQLFCTNDVLTQKQFILVEQIKEWVDIVFAETKLTDLNLVFCGYHASMIASAVLYETKFSDNISGDTVERIKHHLTNIALPVAVLQSNTLRSFKGNNFSDRCDFETAMKKIVFNSEDDGKVECITFLTYSQVTHLDTSFDNNINVLLLPQLSSEKDLIKRLDTFFNSDVENSILLIQCDPISCSQSHINHAQHICTQQKNLYEASGLSNNKHKYIVFIIHMPPGITNRIRHYSFDFVLPWKYYFIDDLRPETALTFDSMIKKSLLDLIILNKVDIRTIVIDKFQYALSFCFAPNLDNDTMNPNDCVTFKDRITLFRRIMEIQEFELYIIDIIILILEKHQRNPDTNEFYHVALASTLSFGGSLRQNLFSAIEMIIIQSLTYVIRFLDRDFNMHLLNDYEKTSQLWYEVLNNPNVFNRDVFAALSKVGTVNIIPETIHNYGKYIPLVAKFPHSYAIIKILESNEMKKNLDVGNEEEKFKRGESTLPLLLGEKLLTLINQFGDECHTSYLHDFVAVTVAPLENLSFDVLLFIYETVIRVTNQDVLTSISKIHIATWINEVRLYVYSSILSSAPFTINSVVKLFKAVLKRTNYSQSTQHRLKLLDSALLSCILDSFWNSLSDYGLMLNQFVNLIKDFETIINMISSSEQNVASASRRLQLSLIGLMTARIIIQEICIPSKWDITQLIPTLKNSAVSHGSAPGTLKHLVNILSMFTKYKIDAVYVCKFFNRYCQEIIFGAREGFLNFGTSHLIEEDLIDTLNNIINGFHKSLPFDQSFVDLTTRRLALYCSLRSKDYLKSPTKIVSPQGLLLYLQNEEDNYAEVERFNLQLSDADKKLLSLNVSQMSDDNTIYSYLNTVAKCKQIIMKFVKVVSLNPRTFTSEIPQDIKDVIATDHENVITYILKALQFFGGVDLLASIIYLPIEEIQWLHIDQKQLVKDDQLIDVFIWFGEEYDNAINLLRKSVSSGSRSKELENYVLSTQWTAPNLLAAIFTEFYLNKDIHVKKGIENTTEILMSGLTKQKYYPIFSWLINSPQPWSAIPNLNESEYENKLKFQVIIHILALTMRYPSSWLHSLLLSPSEHANHFVPSVPDDEFVEIVNASDTVGWYICLNGHPYSVGNCTWPMQIAKCLHPGCGEMIGGSNHVAVKGVTRLDRDEIKGKNKRGYALPNPETIARVSPVPNHMMRFILHSLLLSSLLYSETKESIVDFIAVSQSVSGTLEQLWNRLSFDWNVIKRSLYFGDTDMNIVFHLILKQMTTLNLEKPYLTITDREKFENDFSLCVKTVCNGSQELKVSIKNIKDELSDTGRLISVKKAFSSAGMWDSINETDVNPSVETLLWRIRIPVSYEYFTENFNSSVDNVMHYPTLGDFLKEEAKLPYIKYVADVLCWHNILFEVISNNSITRDEAALISNADILDKVTLTKKEDARQALTNYCKAFNEVLPQIESIFECQDNPYVTANKQVDLSGTKTEYLGMQDSTPIIYSLPSMRGEVDVPGMCTIQIINFLQNSHNQILKKFMENITHDNKTTLMPSINYLTPYGVACKRLIMYNRDEQFLPLIRSYSTQSLDYCEGSSLTFDFKSIEYSLINSIISNKVPLHVQICHFEYRGDIQKSGRLENLCNKVSQINLNLAQQQLILSEIDTLDKFNKLMSQLEVSINFLTSFNSKVSIDSNMLWEEFVKNTLMINEHIWKEITTPTITQQVRLCHLQSLYTCMEEKIKGDPMDNVLLSYRKDLEKIDIKNLNKAIEHLKLDLLLPVIKKFLLTKLTDGKWDASCNLKEYLIYAGQEFDVDLEVDWYENHFPDSLQLGHCYQVYQLLQSHVTV